MNTSRHPHPHKPSHSTPESTLVPGHAGERVAIDGVEVVMVWHIVGKDFSIYHVAFTLLARFVHGLWVGEAPLTNTEEKPDRNSAPFPAPLPLDSWVESVGTTLTWQHLSSELIGCCCLRTKPSLDPEASPKSRSHPSWCDSTSEHGLP